MGNEKFCTEHNTVFFMKGRMKGYAHPIKDTNGNDTGQWCNMSKEQEAMVEQAPHLETPPVVKSGEPKRQLTSEEVKQNSIEQQVAIKEVGEMMRADLLPKLKDGNYTGASNSMIGAYFGWIMKNLDIEEE